MLLWGDYKMTKFNRCMRENAEKYAKVKKYKPLIVAFLKTKYRATFDEIREALDNNYDVEDSVLIRISVLGDLNYFFREKIDEITYYSLSK